MFSTIFIHELKTIYTSKIIWLGTLIFFLLHGLIDPEWGSAFNFVLMISLCGVLAIQVYYSWWRDQASNELLFITQVDSYRYVLGKYFAYALTGCLLCLLCFLGGVFFAPNAEGENFTFITWNNFIFVENPNFPKLTLYHGICYHLIMLALVMFLSRWKRLATITSFILLFIHPISIAINSLFGLYQKYYGMNFNPIYLPLSFPPLLSTAGLIHLTSSLWWLIVTIPFVLLMLNLTVQGIQKDQPSILINQSITRQKQLSYALLGVWLVTEIGFSYFVIHKILGIY